MIVYVKLRFLITFYLFIFFRLKKLLIIIVWRVPMNFPKKELHLILEQLQYVVWFDKSYVILFFINTETKFTLTFATFI